MLAVRALPRIDPVYLTSTDPDEIDDAFLEMYAELDGKNRYFRLSGKPFTRVELVEFCRAGIENGNTFYYSVRDTTDGAVIGSIRIGPIDFRHYLADMVALIGDIGDRGKGLGTAAIVLGQSIAFERHNIRKLSGGVLSPNVGSLKAYTRAGWQEEGRLRDHYLIDGSPVDWIVISCRNPDWCAPGHAAMAPNFLNTAVEPAVPEVVQIDPSAPAPASKR